VGSRKVRGFEFCFFCMMTVLCDCVFVFDVNETLFDLCALDLYFVCVFGDVAVCCEWFATMLQFVFFFIVIGLYFDFGSHFCAVLALMVEK